MRQIMRNVPASFIAGLMLVVLTGHVVAQNNTLHGNAAETQAAGEMAERLKSALAKGDLAACRREGENLARYQRVPEGKALIDADLVAVRRRLKQFSDVYGYFNEIVELNSRKAVEEAYALINDVEDKLISDAKTDVAFVLLTPASLPAKIAMEIAAGVDDFRGSYADATGLVNRANALRSLDKLARHADEQRKSLIPGIRETENLRALLNNCSQQYQDGAASVLGGGNAGPGRTYQAEKGDAESWSRVRVTVSNTTSLKAEDSPGWRNNGTRFAATTSIGSPVTVRVDVLGKGKVSYFDYTTNIVVKTSDGNVLVSEKPVISKDGGAVSYSASWSPSVKSNGISVDAQITGGNPEQFTYFVRGSVQVREKLENSDAPKDSAPLTTPASAGGASSPPNTLGGDRPTASDGNRLPGGATANIEGAWLINGGAADVARGSGNSLLFTNEHGASSRGRIIGADTVIATDWEGGLRGTLKDGGKTIQWANGTEWRRPDSPSSDGSKSTGGEGANNAGAARVARVNPDVSVTHHEPNGAERISGPEVEIFRNGNDSGVSNGGTAATFNLSRTTYITSLLSYHYNNGLGAAGGTVQIMKDDGVVFGPWKVEVINKVYWVAKPNVRLPPGRYRVIDSDPASWSQNSGSNGQGHIIIKGIYDQGSTAPVAKPTERTTAPESDDGLNGALSISGDWACDGSVCKVQQSGTSLTFIKGESRSIGRFSTPNRVIAENWGGLEGRLAAFYKGNRMAATEAKENFGLDVSEIRWSNGSVWTTIDRPEGGR